MKDKKEKINELVEVDSREHEYLINTPLGFFITIAESPIEAWANFVKNNNDISLEFGFCDRRSLIRSGFKSIMTTNESDVFLLKRDRPELNCGN